MGMNPSRGRIKSYYLKKTAETQRRKEFIIKYFSLVSVSLW
jgi:hypothetical protein